MTIGENIKKARKQAGLTQKELGEKLGVTQAAIAKLENDSTNIKLSTVNKIATALDLPITQLRKFEFEKYMSFRSAAAAAIDFDTDINLSIDSDIKHLINNYNLVNADGKEKILTYSDDIAGNPKYKKDNDK